ncbi:hypothetical protein NST54_01015 [Caldifermentibacillus hisashii]|uniref:hypothetical protein n=1 Tax=Caldifermentibacillus hisashii TaxID=996558 RepID=UPI0034D63867
MVIRLFYEEERRKARKRMSEGGKGGIEEGTPSLEGVKTSGETAEILAKKAGISKTNMYNLLAVYRNRPDLFERVFNGEIRR